MTQSSNLLDQLNPQQREAAETIEGPVLILAGAGSGKTRAITYRIAHMIENAGISPDSILAVTFTNKASREMAERVEKLAGGRTLLQPVISTFHSFCVRLLRRDIEALGSGLRKDFAIYDDSDQQQLVKAAIRRLGIDEKQLTPRVVLGRISWAKNHMLDPQEIYLQSADPKTERIAHIYEIYRQELRKANALDFDDLLLEAVRLLKVSGEVRERYNRRFQYLMIDEYQDTNRPQYELMLLLGGQHQNVCVVGDEDQSIYSWRGADIRNILEFERDFPRAKTIRLEQNYRSTQNILEAASAVVANNVNRKGKNLWTARQGGPKVGYYEGHDSENEALFIADSIANHLREAAATNEETRVAVLYRTNAQSRLFEEALRRYQLKYNVVGGFSFYERAEIKDMISYLKLIQNPDDSIALLRVINTPVRGIGKTSVETLERIALEAGLSLWAAIGQAIEQKLLPARALAALENFKTIIEDARAMLTGEFESRLTTEGTKDSEEAQPSAPASDQQIAFDPAAFDPAAFDPFELEDEDEKTPEAQRPSEVSFSEEITAQDSDGAESSTVAGSSTAAILKFLLDRTRYIKTLEEEDTPDAYSRIENLRELVNAAVDSRDRGETLAEFLDHAALVSDADQYDAGAQVTLMTLHSAKGLEFPLVFLAGMEENLFPHSRTLLNPGELEEERRLCYVGMTRAMNTLVLTRARYRRRYGTDMPEPTVASRFLEEVPPHLMEDLGSSRRSSGVTYPPSAVAGEGSHYNYEDEDQSMSAAAPSYSRGNKRTSYSGPTYNSIENIAEFFASRGKKFTAPKITQPAPTGRKGFKPGQRVRHPKYGEGTVYKREGDGDEAKITVQFPRVGLKKLVEKYAQLEKA
ncbi:MAG TPA: UvrD-helicase domain-containing protein [Terriglobales bacterium]|nr:UvrD-helicase domain-containing protein [Terriglobales bacterium]